MSAARIVIAANLFIATSLAAFIGVPLAASAADIPCKKIKLTCSGFEPNWAFTLPGNGTIKFTDPQNPNYQTAPIVIAACAHPLPGNQISITAGAPLVLSATVQTQTCTQPSGQTRPFSIAISYKQGAQSNAPMQISGNGCCWP